MRKLCHRLWNWQSVNHIPGIHDNGSRDQALWRLTLTAYWLTLKRQGGLLGPPRHFARLLCNAQSSRRDTLWLFSFKFPAHFDTKFVTPGGTVLKLGNFLYMHVGAKWLQNVILCTKSMQIEFFYIVHINMLIFTLNGWNEFVLALLCFKKCLPQISPKKTTKNKRLKNKEIHKKFIKQ